jgi:hypothetical protein
MSFARVEYGDFFERRGREGCAEGAKEVKEKEYKVKKTKNKNNFLINELVLKKLFFFGFPFVPSFLRPLQNLRALCVQKLPAFAPTTTTHPTAGKTQ